MPKPYLSIILPPSAKNERCVKDIQSFFQKLPQGPEILLAKNTEELIPTVIKAQGDYVLIMAPGLTVPLVEVLHFLAAFQEETTLDFIQAENDSHFKGFRQKIIPSLFENLSSFESVGNRAEQLGVKSKTVRVIKVGLSGKAP